MGKKKHMDEGMKFTLPGRPGGAALELASGAPAPTVKATKAKKAAAGKLRGRRGGQHSYYERKSTGEDLRRLTVDLPEAMVKELKLWCAKAEVSLSEGLARGAHALLSKAS